MTLSIEEIEKLENMLAKAEFQLAPSDIAKASNEKRWASIVQMRETVSKKLNEHGFTLLSMAKRSIELEKEVKAGGHATKTDGTEVSFSSNDAQQIWESIERSCAALKEDMPDFKTAASRMSRAKERLRELGWAEAIYCPKDGSMFAIMGYGSTFIARANYFGEWPMGHLNSEALHRPEAGMWKPLDKLTADEAALLERYEKDEAEFNDRLFKSFTEESEASND